MYLSNILYLLGNLFPFYYLLRYSDINFIYLLITIFILVFLNIINNIYKTKTLNSIMFALNILSINIILFLSTSSNELLSLIIIFIITLYSIYFSLTAKKCQIRIYYIFILVIIIINQFNINPEYMSVDFLIFACTYGSILNIMVYSNNDKGIFLKKKNKRTRRKQSNNDKI